MTKNWEKRGKQDSGESVPTKVSRTGENNFVVKHDDGSYFEGTVDNPKRFEQFRNLKGNGIVVGISGFGKKKPLVCSVCNKRVYKITCKGGSDYCTNCLS